MRVNVGDTVRFDLPNPLVRYVPFRANTEPFTVPLQFIVTPAMLREVLARRRRRRPRRLKTPTRARHTAS